MPNVGARLAAGAAVPTNLHSRTALSPSSKAKAGQKGAFCDGK